MAYTVCRTHPRISHRKSQCIHIIYNSKLYIIQTNIHAASLVQGARNEVLSQASVYEKLATDSISIHIPQILSQSKKNRIASFNVRTLKGASQSAELVRASIEYKIDIIAIQEHWFTIMN